MHKNELIFQKIDNPELIKAAKSLKNEGIVLQNESYAYLKYSDFNNTSSDFQDPPGNNCLLIAIAAKKDKIAELLIDDARKKLDDKEFLDFINVPLRGSKIPRL